MDFKSFVDRAKDAATAAAEKAKEVATAVADQALAGANAPMTGAPMTGAPTTSMPTTGEPGPSEPAALLAAPDQAQANTKTGVALFSGDKISELTALGAEKVQGLMTSFQQALPALTSAGYELTEFEIELGVTPKLIPHFRHAAQNAENIEHARESLRDNKLGAMLLGALLKAGDIHKQIKVSGFAFSHIEIELGLIPSVRLQYKNEAQV